MSDIFISYSRKDKEFVRRLHAALVAENHNVWVDWEDIPLTADWLAEIYDGIEKADTFIAVLSPDYLVSENCAKEVAHAVKHNKRLAPILRREVIAKDVARVLADINWIPFLERDDFDARFHDLNTAINTDLDWVHAHTRLLIRAIDWDKHKRDDSLVLRGSDLRQAEEWLPLAASKAPQPTVLQSEFIVASRRSATRRLRVILSAVTFGLIVAIILAIVAFNQYLLAEQRNRANLSRRLATEAQWAPANQPQLRVLLATKALQTTMQAGDARIPAAENVLREALANIGGIGLGHKGAVTAVAISPNNRWLLTASTEATARLWDLTFPDLKVRPILLRSHALTVTLVAISPDNHWAVTAGVDPAPRLWNLTARDPSAKPILLQGHTASITALAISPNNRWLATGSADGSIRLWDISNALDQNLASADSAAAIVLSCDSNPIGSVAFSPDGRWLLAHGEGDYNLWEVTSASIATTRLVLKTRESSGAISSGAGYIVSGEGQFAFSPNRRWLITISPNDLPYLWDLTACDPSANPIVLPGHAKPMTTIAALAISTDSRWLATAGFDKTVRLWDLTARDPAAKSIILTGHQLPVTTIAFSPDNRWLATGGGDPNVYLWSLADRTREMTPIILNGSARLMALITPDSHWLVTVGTDTRVWNLKDPNPANESILLNGHDQGIATAASSPNSRWLVTASFDSTARLWDLNNLQPAAAPLTLRSRFWSTTAPVFDPKGRWLIADGGNGLVNLWDLSLPDLTAPLVVLQSGGEGFQTLHVSRDGRWLAADGKGNVEYLWDLEHPTAAPRILRGHADLISATAFSPNSRWLVTASRDATARLWDLNAISPADPSLLLRGHAEWINAVAFSPDNRRLVTGGNDKTMRVWDVSAALNSTQRAAELQPIAILRGHEGAINALAVSPNGRWLASAGADATIRLWDSSTVFNASPNSGIPITASLVLRGGGQNITKLAISPDSRWLADGTPRLWDISNALKPGLTAASPERGGIALHGHRRGISAVNFSADSCLLATASWDGTAQLWDLTAHDPAAEPIVLKKNVTRLETISGVTISPDNHWLATGNEDSIVRVWNLRLDEIVSLACRVVGRNLTDAEWEQYLRGEGAPQKVCAEQP